MIKKTRILILEDQPTDAELEIRELRQAQIDFEAEWVETKETFLKALEEFKPDVIISDYGLPQFNGLEALRLLKELNSDIPFILCTGTLTEQVAVECMKEGATDYILKTSLKRLPSAVLNALEKNESRRAKEEAIAALRQSEEKFRSIIEMTNDWIWAIDLEGRSTYNNPFVETILGYSPEELKGGNFLTFMHEEDREKIEQMLPQFIAEKRGWTNLIWRRRHKDGSIRYLESNAVPILDDDAEVTGYRGADRDITERTQAEDKLRESDEWMRTILNGSRDGIVIEDNGVIVYVNQSFLQLFGYEETEELIGRPVTDFLPPEEAERMMEYGRQRLRGENPPSVYEFKGKRKDGTLIETEAAVSTSVVGGKKYILTASRDITERKKVEEALHESEIRFQQSQKMEAIGTLTGGVAHDFNNLLMTILGNTQLALRKIKPEDSLHTRLTEIENAGNRAAELTRKLLAFSRRQHLVRRTINLNGTIVEIMKLIERVIGADVEISVKYAHKLSAVYADPTQIEQVIMNLSVNARDAMPMGGQLTIETCDVELDKDYCRQYPYVKPGKYVQIRVSDSGSGMDEETQTRIFEPFFTTKDPGKGTGLGLSMAYGIVKQHDGHIHAYSELGRGTTFKIYLPVDAKVVETETKPTMPPSIGGMETILIADDEEPLRNLSKDILEELGYTVLMAKNGEEAIEMFVENRERVDMLLFDVVMPRMGGAEAYEHIRALNADIPLILMTGYSSETVQSQFVKQERSAEALGAIVIQKPCSVDNLERKVREVLDKSQKL